MVNIKPVLELWLLGGCGNNGGQGKIFVIEGLEIIDVCSTHKRSTGRRTSSRALPILCGALTMQLARYCTISCYRRCVTALILIRIHLNLTVARPRGLNGNDLEVGRNDKIQRLVLSQTFYPFGGQES
jgi:hypothetical protein